MCTTRLYTSKAFCCSHPRQAICFSSHTSLHLTSPLGSSHSNHIKIFLLDSQLECVAFSNTRWACWPIYRQMNRNPHSLLGLNKSQQSPALLVSAANIYVCKDQRVYSHPQVTLECLHKRISFHLGFLSHIKAQVHKFLNIYSISRHKMLKCGLFISIQTDNQNRKNKEPSIKTGNNKLET